MKKHRVHLMNSAMMPVAGNYSLYKTDAKSFYNRIETATRLPSTELLNYIGYQQNLDLINKNTGILLARSRGQAVFQDGDTFIVMKLKYRVNNPGSKGEPVNEDDFDFFCGVYKEHP